MTTLMAGPSESPQNLWSSMPGWGIVADLTPPELVASRQLKILRKVIAAVLLGVLVLCVAGYVFAMIRESSASDDLDAARARTTQLTIERTKYRNVTDLQNMTTQINAQVATLLTTDVDAAVMLKQIAAALPPSMHFTAVNLTFSANANAAQTAGAPAVSPDQHGHTAIGNMTLTGTSKALGDVALYVQRLIGVKGLMNVVPNTNTTGVSGKGAWTITLQLTDQLYSHRFDAQPVSGGNR